MYHHLQGRLVEKNPTYAVIECGGVGYLVNISLNTFSRLPQDESVRLFTHLIVREDDLILFGFADPREREVFKLLLSVSGVGANTARLILSSLTPEEVEAAIVTENISLLQSVKGIGAKSAQRIILDLKDKISKTHALPSGVPSESVVSARHEAASALEVLGFSKPAIEKVLSKLLSQDPSAGVEELIKNALKNL
ncbi:MAG: Holliday junction branch migration protein RuvA [Bacteroidota bacterium]|nr:Holliday junction branch migration protein RuvA [Bacteroidota bacterium]MDX5404869.1 Holliday junction branch migration protein RuvA [Bacteroidota bacterium]MDX5428537.1 Holliday junction branch migration protein RuvA [Bacteroidota bacterium]MDX5448308.1 Holliday junction branch migration protein RuvA [Bacteroidota bacterium]MDX5506295.1 Holliday junction branch migration protein RuvA [Bacteroidota bacterium]